MKNSILTGLVAAPFTPMSPDGDLALASVPGYAAFLKKNEVNAVFICGTTGEGSSLTSAERRQLAEAWRRVIFPAQKLVVHVGHLSLREARALAAHAEDIGVDAIATIAPSFFKPEAAVDLVDWCREISAAAPSLPLYYYHMPSMTGVTIPVSQFLQEVDGQIPAFAGVKFTHDDMTDFKECVRLAGDRYELLFGRDEILLSGLELGARGAVGSTYNYAAPLFNRILRTFASGDHAASREDQTEARRFIDILNRHGGISAGKAIMRMVGVDCGPTRAPLRTLSSDQYENLRRELDAIGFFAYACQP